MLNGRIVLEVGIRDKTNRRVLAEIVLVDERIVVRDGLNIGALTALEPRRLALFERVQTVLAIGAEIHPYALIYLSQIGIRFFRHNSVRSKRVSWQNIL
jgi:hypothetical protein